MNRIRFLREAKRIKQGDLARMLNIAQASVSAWESNKAQPSSDNIIKLCNIFGVTSDYLLGISSDSDSVQFHAHRTGGETSTVSSADIEMVKNLQAISDLYNNGNLTEEEFKIAKRRILGL